MKKGDTWSEIAEAHGITSKELESLNPGYNIDKLQIGEILTMSASVPYLTMTVVQQERYVDSVAFDVEPLGTAMSMPLWFPEPAELPVAMEKRTAGKIRRSFWLRFFKERRLRAACTSSNPCPGFRLLLWP